MMFYRVFFLLILKFNLFSQTYINDTDWSFHLNIKDSRHIAFYDNSIYSFSANGLFSLDITNNSILRNNNAIELNNLRVSVASQNSEYFVLGLSNGIIVIYNSDNKNFVDLNTEDEDLIINSLKIYGDNLYVSSSSGLIIVSIEENYIIERYNKIGENGNPLNILESLVINNDIYVLSPNGVYIFDNHLNNPLDYRSWTKLNFNTENPKGLFLFKDSVFYYFDNKIYDAELNLLYINNNIKINKIKIINDDILITYNDLISKNDRIAFLNDSELTNVVLPDIITHINDFIYADGSLWVAGDKFSLYNINKDEFFSPTNTLNFTPDNIIGLNDDIYAFSGNRFSINSRNTGWENITLSNFTNITSIAKYNNQTYIASSSHGILNFDQNLIIDELYENSLLYNDLEEGIHVSDIKLNENQLWLLNYGSMNPLLSFDNNNQWKNHNLKNNSPLFPVEFKFKDEYIWIVIDPLKGGGIIIYNTLTQQKFDLSEDNGLLNSNNVNDISIDNNGYVWIATDEGLIYFSSYNPNDFSSYLTPNDGSQFLFKGVNINSIEIDYENNIWIGSENGLYVFNNMQNNFVFQFKKSNTPLLSDNIGTIKFNDLGSAYILTADGLMSLNTSFSKPKENLLDFKVYPNPLKIKEEDRLFFTGFSSGNYIKVTSLSGEEIISLEVQSGGFNWNLFSRDGIKIKPGVYLIFIVSDEGNEKLITKVLVL